MAKNLLEAYLDKRVIITLRDDKEFRGKLIGFDQRINIILVNSQELINREKNTIQNIGTIILRSDSVVMVNSPRE